MRIHVSLDIAGSLKNWNPGEYRGHFTDRETGRVLSPEEFRWQLIDRLALGEKHLQLDPECKTFDPATGCLGCLPDPAPKKPLGVSPRWLVDEHRAEELILAIGRYRDAGAWPDTAWAEELAETLGRINRRTPLPDGPMPYGILPRSALEQKRAEDLAAAIGRYDEEGLPPDAAWVEELAELRRRPDGEPAKKLKVAFDIGGVLSKFPHQFRPLVADLVDRGHDVHVITDMHDMDEILRHLGMNGFVPPIRPENVHSADYKAHGEGCKAVLLRDLEIEMFVDDFPGYVAWPFETPAPLRLQVAPDPRRTYWHPDWALPEGTPDWGRRKFMGPHSGQFHGKADH